MKRRLVGGALAALAVAGAAAPAFADWSKTYVIEWNEPAFYYGAKTGVIDPGTTVTLAVPPPSHMVCRP